MVRKTSAMRFLDGGYQGQGEIPCYSFPNSSVTVVLELDIRDRVREILELESDWRFVDYCSLRSEWTGRAVILRKLHHSMPR